MSAALPARQPPARSHRRLLIALLIAVGLAFGFGFALVPLYDALCRMTGLNGKTSAYSDAIGLGGLNRPTPDAPSPIDTHRTITVEFIGTVMPGLQWDMQPLTTRMDLHPGALQQAVYRVHNRSNQAIVGQAVPSVSPGLAAQYFHKLECFCFRQQTLAPGETKDMPLVFVVKPEIDTDIHTITLAYAFFNVTAAKSTLKRVATR